MRHSQELTRALLVFLLTACSDSPSAPIGALATVEVVGAGGGGTLIINTLRFNLGIHPPNTDPPPLANSADLFGQLWLTAADQGRTLIASPDTEDDFNTFASFLTNGVDDFVVEFVGTGTRGADGEVVPHGGGGEIKPESNFFRSRPTPGVDFAGYSITRIEFRIDSISLVTTGEGGTDFYLHGKLAFFGRRN